MTEKTGRQQAELFADAIKGKKIPILTLDNKWYRLLDEVGKASVKEEEDQLNRLLQRQGQLNNDVKDIRRLKKKLMAEIVPLVDEMENGGNSSLEKKLEDHKRLVAECNEKLDAYQEELLEIPHRIDEINHHLMLLTMEYCYDVMQEVTATEASSQEC